MRVARMADLGVHRSLCAGWLTGAFCLHHVVQINYAGKTVLAFGGAGLWALGGEAALELRCVGLANAILMVLGQFWYSAFWGSPAAIVSYVTSDTRHVLNGCTRALCCKFNKKPLPGLMTLCACCYYAAFCGLFAWAAALESGTTLPFAYGVAASAWHGWCGLVLLLSAMFTCGGCATQLGDREVSKLTGGPTSAVGAGVAAAPAFLDIAATAGPCPPLQATLEAKSNINLNASEPVIGPGTNDHHTKC